jgi:hypothetical protein
MSDVIVILNEEIATRQKRLDDLAPALTEAHGLMQQIQALRESLLVLTQAPHEDRRRCVNGLTPLVLDVLKASPLPMTPLQIADACGAKGYPTTNASVSVILNRYLKQQEEPVKKLAHGLYHYVGSEIGPS